MSNVLVLAVHPDDETLGCGGTLLKHKEKKDNIFWLIATEMQESLGYEKKQISERVKCIETVASTYGFSDTICLSLPTTRVDQLSHKEIVDKISIIFNRIKPEIVYLPFSGDVHSDHKLLFNAAYSCCKTFRAPYIKKILMMESISETEYANAGISNPFSPNTFVDVSNFFERKIEIIKLYKSELNEFPAPRSIENIRALAMNRGAIAGCSYAESFMLLKDIR